MVAVMRKVYSMGLIFAELTSSSFKRDLEGEMHPCHVLEEDVNPFRIYTDKKFQFLPT